MIKDYKGFTLIELLLAAAIMATAIVAILHIFIGCSFLVGEYRNHTIAVNHARLVMEEIKNASYISLASAQSPGWGAWATAPGGGGCNVLDGEDITVSFSGAEPLINVLVTVNYRGRRQMMNPALEPLTVSLRSHITNE
jgi:prepilin-type N-terminal cleavage/methylation domain-containing protein